MDVAVLIQNPVQIGPRSAARVTKPARKLRQEKISGSSLARSA
jgi:hypothetical protein